VFYGTVNIAVADANGVSLRVHFVTNVGWTPGSDPSGPPHATFDKIVCSYRAYLEGPLDSIPSAPLIDDARRVAGLNRY
jgi:hypothetical protein